MELNTNTNLDGKTVHLFAVNLLEKLIEVIKGGMTLQRLDFCTKWLSVIGHFGIMAAAGIGFLFSLIFAIRTDSFSGFLIGLAWVVLIFVVQYTAHKFSSAGEGLIKDNPSQLTSKIFLDCFGFLVLIGGLVVFVITLLNWVKGNPLADFLMGLGIVVVLLFVAAVAFNFKAVTVEIVQGNSAGQEALGVVTFFIKTFMKLVPILFGALIVLGTVLLFLEGTRLFSDAAAFAWFRMTRNIAPQILYAALLPFLSYLIFILAYLGIDIIRAILCIPELKNK